MGMSTKIKAFTPETNERYQKHLKVYRVCTEAGVSLPKETMEYFKDCDEPEEILETTLVEGRHYHEWSTDMEEGFEVNINELPVDVAKIRFYNSY